jgi:hypothetical protein
MIPVLSLLVAALAVFFGPLVTWTVARKQITVATREAWMREFREQVAALLTSTASFRDHVRTHSTDDPKDEQRLAKSMTTGCGFLLGAGDGASREDRWRRGWDWEAGKLIDCSVPTWIWS